MGKNRKGGKKKWKGIKRKKGEEQNEKEDSKVQAFYNLDLTSNLSQTCFLQYVSLGAYYETTEKPWSDTA